MRQHLLPRLAKRWLRSTIQTEAPREEPADQIGRPRGAAPAGRLRLGPSDADIAKALTDFAVGLGATEKHATPKSLKDSKCSKAEGGNAWKCDFLVEDAPHHGRFVKFGDRWKLVGQLG